MLQIIIINETFTDRTTTTPNINIKQTVKQKKTTTFLQRN